MNDLRNSYESLVLSLNKKAMDELRLSHNDKAFECLNEAEKLVKSQGLSKEMWAITMNNYGCYYKKINKLQEALSCLNLALSKERALKYDNVNKAATYLNISSIYSALSVHESALFHAQCALKILKSSQDRSENALTTLIVAFHSVGIELEALSRTAEAVKMYKNGWELAKQALYDSHPLTITLKKNMVHLSQHQPIRLSKSRKFRNSKTRDGCRRVPSHPVERDSFPLIDKKKSLSICRDQNFPKKFLPSPPRRVVKGIDKSKIEGLSNLIDEIEEGMKEKLTSVKEKVRDSESRNSSVAVQVEMMRSDNRIGLSRKMRKGKDRKNLELSEIRVRDAIKEAESLRKLKNISEECELTPIPRSSKVEFYRSGKLHTIYESKYEDQKESFVLIQSVIRMFIQSRRYKKMRAAAVKIQRCFRKYMTRKLYKNIKAAVLFIQSVFRGHRVRKIYKFLLNKHN